MKKSLSTMLICYQRTTRKFHNKKLRKYIEVHSVSKSKYSILSPYVSAIESVILNSKKNSEQSHMNMNMNNL